MFEINTYISLFNIYRLLCNTYLFYKYVYVAYLPFSFHTTSFCNVEHFALGKKSETINTVTLGRLSNFAWTNPFWFFRDIMQRKSTGNSSSSPSSYLPVGFLIQGWINQSVSLQNIWKYRILTSRTASTNHRAFSSHFYSKHFY